MLAERANGGGETSGSAMPTIGVSVAVTPDAGFVSTDGAHGAASIDEVHHGRWLIIATPETNVPEDIVRRVGAVVVRADGDGAARRQLLRCDTNVVIVRPDRIVFGWGDSGLAALTQFANRYL